MDDEFGFGSAVWDDAPSRATARSAPLPAPMSPLDDGGTDSVGHDYLQADLGHTDPLSVSEPHHTVALSQNTSHSIAENFDSGGWGFGVQTTTPKPLLLNSSSAVSTTTITTEPAVYDPLANVGAASYDEENGLNESFDNLRVDQEESFEFEVTVTEPQKVGHELISGHILYRVSTWTNCPGYTNASFSVSRRYSDFLWLYGQLVERYPGAIVCPLPAKQNLGRFQEDFIESRRVGLEKFLKKVVNHVLLQRDADLRVFLESTLFAAEKKETRPNSFIAVAGLDSSAAASAFSSTSPRILDDVSLEDLRQHIETCDEPQLRVLAKALMAFVKQRRDVANASNDFGDALLSLAEVESGKDIGRNLAIVGNIQKQIRDLEEAQAAVDLEKLVGTVESYLQSIGSVRVALAGRNKFFLLYQSAAAALHKKKESIEKFRSKTRGGDEINTGLNNLPDLERQMNAARADLQKVTDLLRRDLVQFESERVADFTDGVKAVLKGLLEMQKEVIRLWESYFEMSGQPMPESLIKH
ncbi:Vacuolar protein sorting-associated protein 5 [Entophlyctis luteolus]|nr:Vacuolar protein sorting-associated protein 5 [Entophlyctis luteolus]